MTVGQLRFFFSRAGRSEEVEGERGRWIDGILWGSLNPRYVGVYQGGLDSGRVH